MFTQLKKDFQKLKNPKKAEILLNDKHDLI